MGTMRCYRRNEMGASRLGDDSDTPDSFEKNHGLVGQPSGCSYCGSLDPALLLDLIRKKTVRLEATDKSYKIYVHDIPREGDPEELRVVSHGNSPNGGKPWTELSKAEKQAVRKYVGPVSKRWSGYKDYKKEYWGFMKWGSTVEGKFYTGHFSQDQGDEFIRLDMAGEVPWGYRPYRPLYIPHSQEMQDELTAVRGEKDAGRD